MKKKMNKSTRPKPSHDSGTVHVVPNAHKRAILAALATMPDEAFGWVVVWAAMGGLQGAGKEAWETAHQMFPDGLGGFSDASRQSIEAVRNAAKAYLETSGK